MKRTPVFLAFLAVLTFGAVGSVYAMYSVWNEGIWPKSWPAQLEPLRKQAKTLEGPMTAHRHYAIPFTQRKDLEAAWPYLLKVKTRRAPILLVRGPNFFLGQNAKAGIVIHCPPPEQAENPATPEAPINSADVRERWLYTTYIELVVDKNIVDLNRLSLPADTPIVDERFENIKNPALKPAGN